jgi:hypothetical protein
MGTLNTHLGLGLAGVAAIAAAAIARSQAAPNEAVYLLFGAGLVSIALGACGLIYDGVRAWRRRKQPSVTSLVNIQQIIGGTQHFNFGVPPDKPLPTSVGPQPWMEHPQIVDRSLRIADLPRIDRTLRNKQLQRCSIYGPAVVAFSGSGSLVRNDFADPEEQVLWEVPDKWKIPAGVIPLDNIQFVDCHFSGITFAGPRWFLDKFRSTGC